jgi:hypothetical protein
MKTKSRIIERGRIFFGDKNDLIKSKLDKKIILKMFNEYTLIRPGIPDLSINNLMTYTRDELFYLYHEYKIDEYARNEDRDNDPTYKGIFFKFEGYKNTYLLEHPEENPPKPIKKEQALNIILFYYKYHNKEDFFLSNIKKNKVKMIDLISFIKHKIKNYAFYVEELLKEQIQDEIKTRNYLKWFVKPSYMEENLKYEKEINYNFKLN